MSDFGRLTGLYYGPTGLAQDDPKLVLSGDIAGNELYLEEIAGWYWATGIYDNDDTNRFILNVDDVYTGTADKSYGLALRCIAR